MSNLLRVVVRAVSVTAALALIAALVVAPTISPAHAEGKTTVCDSTTILLLYVAEHDYGFKSMKDVSMFEKGQYKPLFEAMMAKMDGGKSDKMMGTANAMMEGTSSAMMDKDGDKMMATSEAMMGTADAMSAATMMTQLKPAAVAGEPTACTDLRGEVEAFLYAKLSSGMMK